MTAPGQAVESGQTDEPRIDEEESSKTLMRKTADAIWFFLKDQWFLSAMALVILIASQVQVPLSQQSVKQVTISYLSVTIIFFVAGCTLPTRMLIENYAKWKHHLFIQGQCFILVSALAFAVVSLTATNSHFMDAWLLIGLIFNGCQPTAMASNVLFTRQSRGNATLTVVETTIGNLIGPFLTPALITMYLSTSEWYTKVIPDQATGYQGLYRRVFMQFGLSIYLPMAVGQVVRYLFPKAVQKVFIDWKLIKIGSFGMLTLLWQTFDHAFATGAFSTAKTSNIVFIVLITVVNYAVWLIVSFLLSILWLDRKDTVSVAMTAPAKTLALGMPLSFLMFEGIGSLQEAKMQVPMLIFQVLQMGLASLSTLGFRRWVDAGEKQVAKSRAVEGSKDAPKKEDEQTEVVNTDEKNDIEEVQISSTLP